MALLDLIKVFTEWWQKKLDAKIVSLLLKLTVELLVNYMNTACCLNNNHHVVMVYGTHKISVLYTV
jgi:hypothetical protein